LAGFRPEFRHQRTLGERRRGCWCDFGASYGCGYSVRVSFSRGRFRLVDSPSLSVVRVRRVVGGYVGPDEVSVLEEVVVVWSPLMSVVTGGLVLVTVSVVVVGDVELVRLEKVGSSM
jgi:hypothetical protein